jgi:hypothetical protein
LLSAKRNSVTAITSRIRYFLKSPNSSERADYRTSGRWMFHDTTLKALKKLKDGQGRPLWRPGVRDRHHVADQVLLEVAEQQRAGRGAHRRHVLVDRTSGRWMFHDTTLKALKKLKDGQGRPLWRPGVTASWPAAPALPAAAAVTTPRGWPAPVPVVKCRLVMRATWSTSSTRSIRPTGPPVAGCSTTRRSRRSRS